MNPKTDTLFGGRLVPIKFLATPDAEAYTEGEIKVRQIPVRDYERAFKLIEDEIALVGLMCGRDKKWAETLAPESYEDVQAAMEGVNAKGFFGYSERRKLREQKTNEANIAAMASLSPEAIKVAIQSASPTGSPTPRPRPI